MSAWLGIGFQNLTLGFGRPMGSQILMACIGRLRDTNLVRQSNSLVTLRYCAQPRWFRYCAINMSWGLDVTSTIKLVFFLILKRGGGS